jgi:hypothetical protein
MPFGNQSIKNESHQAKLEQDGLTLQKAKSAPRHLGPPVHVDQIKPAPKRGEIGRREIERRRHSDSLDLDVVGIGGAIGRGLVDQIGNFGPDLFELLSQFLSLGLKAFEFLGQPGAAGDGRFFLGTCQLRDLPASLLLDGAHLLGPLSSFAGSLLQFDEGGDIDLEASPLQRTDEKSGVGPKDGGVDHGPAMVTSITQSVRGQ